MHRFRLLGFYVAGVVIVIALAIWGTALRRRSVEAEAPQAPVGQPTSSAIPQAHARSLAGVSRLDVYPGTVSRPGTTEYFGEFDAWREGFLARSTAAASAL